MTAAEALVARTCDAQGLPHQVTDRAVLARIAALLGPERGSAPVSSPGRREDRRLAGHEEVSRGKL